MSARTTNDDIYEAIDKLRREIKQDVKELKEENEKTFLQIKVFESEIYPLKRFVYGIIGICGVALITAMMALVLR
jgi:gas vesicle protein